MTATAPTAEDAIRAADADRRDDGPLRLGLLISHLRPEEKAILAAARARGLVVTTMIDRELVLDLNASSAADSDLAVDVVLDRSVAHTKALYTLRTMDRRGVPTLNTPWAVAVCDDKVACSLALAKAGVPTPRTVVCYSVESALRAAETLGYPLVLKPVTGSWGRLLARINGPEQMRTILGQKTEHGGFHHEVLYLQEFVEKPGRDIRAYVVGGRVLAASYRSSEHWVTNAARGAISRPCPVTPEIERLSLLACDAVDARMAGVDLFETGDGLQVVEVNSGGEFKGLQTTTDVDIAAEIVTEAVRIAERSKRAETASSGSVR
jgi:[lysine-biosynthesis-protein LysW]--L-2-aminoadipate ligase